MGRCEARGGIVGLRARRARRRLQELAVGVVGEQELAGRLGGVHRSAVGQQFLLDAREQAIAGVSPLPAARGGDRG